MCLLKQKKCKDRGTGRGRKKRALKESRGYKIEYSVKNMVHSYKKVGSNGGDDSRNDDDDDDDDYEVDTVDMKGV